MYFSTRRSRKSQSSTKKVTFQFFDVPFFIYRRVCGDVNVMNMLMLILLQKKGSTLLKSHPSCSNCCIFHALSCEQLVTWEKAFAIYIKIKTKIHIELVSKSIMKTNTILLWDKSHFLVRKLSIEIELETHGSKNNGSSTKQQSAEREKSSLKIYEFSHHNNFMVVKAIEWQ